jgi:serine/threonine-protein kinase
MQPAHLYPMPARIGRYEILVRIASGGMATVYLARGHGAAGFEHDVAIKVTHPHLRESADFARELVEEAKLAVRIRHANVVPVLDVGDDPLGLFLVMEYVEGDTLSGLMRRASTGGASLSPSLGLRILLDALAGLHAAHELKDDSGNVVGLVHRDFSPQNILVGLDGVARLIDFGIAKAATRLGQTRTGIVKGKVAYMAPEQARGQPVDRRCDVWAAGVIAWELFAGRRMHDGSIDEVGLIFRIATEMPPRLRSVRPEAPPAIDEAIARALTPNRDERFPTAAAFAQELGRAIRASGMPLADASEVAAHVEQVAGARLGERRERAASVLGRRREGAEVEPVDAAELRSEEISLHTAPSTATAPASGKVVRAQHTEPPEAAADTIEVVSASAHVPQASAHVQQPSARNGSRAVVVACATAAAAAVAFAIALGVSRVHSRTEPSSASASASAPPSASEGPSAAAAAPVSAAPIASSSPPVQALPPARVAAPQRIRTPGPTVRAPPAAKPQAAPPPTKKTPNLDEPF